VNHLVLIAAVAASAALAACGAPADSSDLGLDPSSGATDQGAIVTAPPTTAVSQPTPLPVPTRGPGSNDSTARQYFIDQVYPSLQTTCASCHATGLNGAPMFLQTNAATAYQTLDVRGMIQPQSLLLNKGQHLGPMLAPAQRTLVQTWLDKEAKERVGQAAPVNILDKIGECLDQTLFDAIGFEALRTEPGDDEDADTCTGCDHVQCNRCHTAGDGNFYMAVGSGLDDTTFQKTREAQFIIKYIGLNGATPVASNAIEAKSQSTIADPMHYHPMFKITPEMQQAIATFANNAIYKYLAGQCGK
jgi:hypothetical protein